MATISNHSRNYYLSNENMSDIKESIQEYSMNFQQGASGTGSQIAEMISGSHQASQSRQSKFNPKSKHVLPTPEIIVQQNNYVAQADGGDQPQQKKGIYLGDHVFNITKERYFETNKITTDDPEVLYDFYLGQRKNLHTMKPITQKQIQKQMPSMQRKLLVKFKFQKILTYYPQDVYYSLCYFYNKQQIDRKAAQNVQLLNKQTKKPMKKKVTKKQLDNIVQKLYKNNKKQTQDKNQKTNKNFTNQEAIKIKRHQFGRNLSQHFQNTFRGKQAPICVQSPQKLYSFWSDLYQREQYGIQWDQDTALQNIQLYMYEQIDDLMKYAANKLGFKCTKADSLFKFYKKNQQKVQKFIFVPYLSFQQYVKTFNNIQLRKQNQQDKLWEEKQKKQNKKQKIQQTKQFGRPVSATPLTILSQPKNHSLSKHKKQLYSKYPHNQILKHMQAQENLKKPRYAFQYGVYDLIDQAKTKQWVKIDTHKKITGHEAILTKKLVDSMTNQGWLKQQQTDRLSTLFAQQNLAQDEHWKNLGPVMHEAMLVKAYQNKWFTDCIIKYLQRVLGETDLKYEPNNILFKKLFNYLTNQLDQHSRQSQLSKLETYILTSESIHDKTKQMNSISDDPKVNANKMRKQKRLVYDILQQKAIQWVKMRNKQGTKVMLRSYLKDLFEQIMKQHKAYVIRQFNVVEGSKDVPKLLKYQFFKLIKEINPITLERQAVPRSHAWVPTKQHALPNQNINYKTFNHVSQQKKQKSQGYMCEPQSLKMKNELWGWKNQKDRQYLLMGYQDAKQCTFHPKISRKQV